MSTVTVAAAAAAAAAAADADDAAAATADDAAATRTAAAAAAGALLPLALLLLLLLLLQLLLLLLVLLLLPPLLSLLLLLSLIPYLESNAHVSLHCVFVDDADYPRVHAERHELLVALHVRDHRKKLLRRVRNHPLLAVRPMVALRDHPAVQRKAPRTGHAKRTR